MRPPTGKTKVLTVIGHPVAHSLSPTMYNAAFTALGLDAVYVAADVHPDRLAEALVGFKAAGIGGNITIPHKVNSLTAMDRLSASAKQIGAANTFWVEDGKLHADNTDIDGVIHAANLLEADGPWLVLGTGGSARAVVAAAAKTGVSVKIRSRSESRASEFSVWAREIGASAEVDDATSVGTIVNTTPIGLSSKDQMPLGQERMAEAGAVLDLVYRRGGTDLIRRARKMGLRAIDGREVLVGQGREAFRRFFPHVEPPVEIMRAAVTEVIGAL